MSDTPQRAWPRGRRKTWIVDPATQLRAVFTVIGIGATFLLFGIVARFWNLRDGSAGLDSDQAGRLALLADALFVVFALGAVGVYVVWLTHRFAGPARVIRTALEGMAEGDFGRRLTLRKRDFLKDVAAAAAEVARTMRADRTAASELVAAVNAALERGDSEAARAALLEFQRRTAAPVEPVEAALAD